MFCICRENDMNKWNRSTFSFSPSLSLPSPCSRLLLMSKLLAIKTFVRVSIRLCERQASALLSWDKSQIKIKTSHTTHRQKNEGISMKKWKNWYFSLLHVSLLFEKKDSSSSNHFIRMKKKTTKTRKTALIVE